MSDRAFSATSVAPWLRFLAFYAAYSVIANLAWEIAQLPLYTLWRTATSGYLAFAVLHCTAGDVLIALTSLLGALPLAGLQAWPPRRFTVLVVAAVALGLAYTAYSEWLNFYVRRSWAYAEAMPLLPGLGIGLSPLLQWLIIPVAGLLWARQRAGEHR